MIDYIKGEVAVLSENSVTIENSSGMGYLFTISESTYMDLLGKEGEGVKLFSYMAIRENDVSLFGFSTEKEREVFFKLITVPKIGPKIGVSILSSLTPQMVINAVLGKDAKALTAASGVGKKAAEQIIVTLSDKFKEEDLEAVSFTEITEDVEMGGSATAPGVIKDAISALTNLGFTEREVSTLCKEIGKENEYTIEELIGQALQKLNI